MATVTKFVVTEDTGQRMADAMEEMASGVVGDTLAPMFSTTSTYAVGDLVIYNKHLYRCTTAVTTAGAWDSSKWTQTTMEDELAMIPIARGGTGANNASSARTNLGLGTAATKSTSTSITNSSSNIPTASAVYSYTRPVVVTAAGASAPSDTRALWVYPNS